MLTQEHPPDRRSMAAEDLMLAVRFEAGCWLLDSRRRFETLVYRSGGAAENAARTMATRLAEVGQGVRVSVEDRRHAVVGTRIYFPCDVTRRIDLSDERSAS